MAECDVADLPSDALVGEPQDRGGGFHRYQSFQVVRDGVTFERDSVRIGKIAVILPVDLDRDEIVMIRQFRLSAQLAIGLGELIEIPAGHVERGEEPIAAARRECEEETSLTPRSLVPLFDLMPCPGATDEHMFFFLALVDAANLPERAGAAHEQEDTRPFRLPVDRALELLAAGQLHYGAAVIALQWLALNRARLPDIVRQGPAR
jgi:ADP-ribose pyrophosphatase